MFKLSIVIPVFNNEKNLALTYQVLRDSVLIKLNDYEVILVDDGSKDASWDVMQSLRNQDQNIKLIKLSKNFGSITAQLAGLTYAEGDCVSVISADLQDPPEIILQLLEKWKKGVKVCLAVRKDRKDGFGKKIISNLFYKIMQKFALENMPLKGFDCFVIDKKVVEIIKNIEEKNSSIVGQILWSGFKSEQIYYTRQVRKEGKSQWTLAKKVKYFIDSILSFSHAPIRAITLAGFVISAVSFLIILALIIKHFFIQVPVQGWTSLVCLILLTFGIQLIIFGVIGEYLWRILDESRKRPPFIIEEKQGIKDNK